MPYVKSPNKMKTPMYMKSPVEFNAGLKKASADGKLDNNPKFKAAVDASPNKAKGVIDSETEYDPIADREKDAMKKGDRSAMTMKSPMEMKKSPYTMYGKEMSPAQMQGRSPLAKTGCSKRL
tara:strand:- start:8 stop:373 length:366 start_codon:yes stop_codon:yes gene_type:complete